MNNLKVGDVIHCYRDFNRRFSSQTLTCISSDRIIKGQNYIVNYIDEDHSVFVSDERLKNTRYSINSVIYIGKKSDINLHFCDKNEMRKKKLNKLNEK